METEKWLPIKGYEGRYEVSDRGRVRSLDRVEIQKNGVARLRKGKILYLKKNNKGYRSVGLSKDYNHTFHLVHRLVAIAFIPNPLNLECINHKDCNPLNNTVDNIEWCTYQYNSTYKDRIEKSVAKRCKRVEQYTLLGEYVTTHRSANYAAVTIGVAPSGVYQALSGVYKTYGGYIWRYEKQ